MKFTERLIVFLKTLNPDAYEKLCSMTVLDAWKQFFFNFILLFVVMLLLFIPAAMLKAPLMESRLAAFDSLALSANATADGRVTLLKNPTVVVDLSENPALGREKVLLSNEGVAWKPYYYFGERFVAWEDINDLSQSSSTPLFLMILFLAPSIAFWFGSIFLLIYLVEILFFSLIAWLLPRIWRHKVRYTQSLKLSLFAATVMMLVEMLLLPFWWNWWIPFLLYLLFFAIGIALVGDRELSAGKKKGRTHEIWD